MTRAAWLLVAGVGACIPPPPVDAGVEDGGTPFAAAVVSFTPGPGAGYGQDLMPDVVLGPPVPGASSSEGSTDVVTLGRGGTITLELGAVAVDHDGVDLIVFENPFESAVGAYKEPGEVAVSSDGEAFTAFPCAPTDAEPNGCAGYALAFTGAEATDHNAAGGDGFDFAALGVDDVRFVRVTDVGTGPGTGETAGFDLDAIAIAR